MFRRRLTALILAVGAITCVRPIAAAAFGPEQARLAAMCGTWDAEMSLWPRPGGAAIALKATSTILPLFDGRFIEEAIEGTLNGATFKTLAWTGFNTSTHQYEATRISSTNTARIAEAGTYDEKANQFELKADYALGGETWHQRTVIQQSSADAMVAVSYLSIGTGPEWKAVEIKYVRRSPAKLQEQRDGERVRNRHADRL